MLAYFFENVKHHLTLLRIVLKMRVILITFLEHRVSYPIIRKFFSKSILTFGIEYGKGLKMVFDIWDKVW